jgi:phenylpropionate dioxygenase-like ring-hydroxylating dioxygenase large terminal subunit
VRAFHNICRHRGNKLVWNDYPREEVSGVCRQFTCKYHGWRYDLEGALHLRAAGAGILRPRQDKYGLVAVQCEIWEGFIWVNVDPDNTMSVADYLGTSGPGWWDTRSTR